MDRDNYNIDDILEEVKRHKESADAPKIEEAPEVEEIPEVEEAPEVEEFLDEEIIEIEETPEEEEIPEAEEIIEIEEAPEEEDLPEAEAQDGSMVNLFDLADDEDEKPEEDELPIYEAEPEAEEAPAKKKATKTTKILRAVIAVLLVLLIAAGGVFVWANGLINNVLKNNDEESTQVATTEEWQGMKTLTENFPEIKETEADELSSLEDMIKTWYYNGAPCSSSHVLNVLLIGEDTRGKQILEEGTRADSAIIASLNIDTKQITLVSVLRDAWAYWEGEAGNEDSGEFGKINGAMSLGNVRCYMRSIENLYKIKLDGYAIVNFTSFEKIIKTLGGVTLEITEAEINEINNHPKRYGNVTIEKTFEGKKGEMKLNGKQALAYCRIRHIDTDNARADRQKTTLIALFNQSKNASTTKLLKIVQDLSPYIKTSFSKNEIVKIARYAISKNWLDYETNMTNIPEYNLKGGNFKPEYLSQWVWKADFPADAYFLQMRLYGKSSITLAKTRVDTAKVRQSGFYKDGARATYDTVENKNYGEVTTLPPTTEKEDDE